MKRYQLLAGSTDLSSLALSECDVPEPGDDQVLVRIRAASLNYRDHAIVSGNYFGGVLQRDTVPLSDGAGEVVAVGSNVTRFRNGDRVCPVFFQGWIDGRLDPATMPALGSPADGVLTEYAVFGEAGLVAIPGHLSYEEAATLPCAALTAWNALNHAAHVTAGQTVLALGTGGVSVFALQFAKMAGAAVVITSSSNDKLERAKKLGADHLINYRETPDWDQAVLELTGGVDHVIEVGGMGTLARSMQAVGYGGQVTLIGVVAGREGDANPHVLMLKNAGLRGMFVGSRTMFEHMNRAISINGLRPVVDKVFGFDEVKEAFDYQWNGKHFGKVVISVGD